MTEAHNTKAARGVDWAAGRPPTRTPVVLIAAVGRNGVIGQAGRMPWSLPGDLAHFRRATLGRPVVMGRRTYDSIGRPLPGRPTIVLSRDPAFNPTGVIVTRTLPDALRTGDREATALGADAVMVAGGGLVYAATIAGADRLLLTDVDVESPGDALFPAIDPRQWFAAERWTAEPSTGDTARYSFTRWERRSP